MHFLAPTIQSKENANCVILCTLRIGYEVNRMQVSASTCTYWIYVTFRCCSWIWRCPLSAVHVFELNWTDKMDPWTRFHVGMVNIGTPSLSAHHFLGYPASCNLPILLPPYRSPVHCLWWRTQTCEVNPCSSTQRKLEHDGAHNMVASSSFATLLASLCFLTHLFRCACLRVNIHLYML
jgi:hypothetical protein